MDELLLTRRKSKRSFLFLAWDSVRCINKSSTDHLGGPVVKINQETLPTKDVSDLFFGQESWINCCHSTNSSKCSSVAASQPPGFLDIDGCSCPLSSSLRTSFSFRPHRPYCKNCAFIRHLIATVLESARQVLCLAVLDAQGCAAQPR